MTTVRMAMGRKNNNTLTSGISNNHALTEIIRTNGYGNYTTGLFLKLSTTLIVSSKGDSTRIKK